MTKLYKGGTDESSNVLKGLYAINEYFNNYIYINMWEVFVVVWVRNGFGQDS